MTCVAAGGQCVIGPDARCAGQVLTTYDCNPQRNPAGAICCLASNPPDAGVDAGPDAGIDGGLDAGPDAGLDAGVDAGPDAGPDAGADAGIDAGPFVCVLDAGMCTPGVASDLSSTSMTKAGPFWALASGDLNGDGLLDLVAVRTPLSDEYGFRVFFGEPDGGLSSGVSYPLSYGGRGIAIGDIDGDGFPDVAIADGDQIDIFANDGGGGLNLLSLISASDSVGQVGIGDFNGDGIADLAFTVYFADVEIALGQGSGTFSTPAAIPGVGGGHSGILVVADLNQDCLADIVADLPANPNGGLVVLINLGDGGFQQTSYATPAYPSQAAVIPNPSGPPDLVFGGLDTGNSTGIQVLKNNGDGTFALGPSATVAGEWIAVGDFNGDCIPDIATSLLSDCHAGDSQLWVLYGEADGGLSAPQNLQQSQPSGLLAVVGPIGSPRAFVSYGNCAHVLTVFGDASRH